MGKKGKSTISMAKQPKSKGTTYEGGDKPPTEPPGNNPSGEGQGIGDNAPAPAPEGSDSEGMPQPSASDPSAAAAAAADASAAAAGGGGGGGFIGGGLTSRGSSYVTQDESNTSTYPGTTNSAYKGPHAPDAAPLIAPVGGQMPKFSMGNSANGNINLGSILGSRANPSYDPNNPGATLPYQNPGFFRRLLGDNGGELNQQYATSRNASLLGQRQADSAWQRQADFQREMEKSRQDSSWGQEKARLDMQAAIANQGASNALKLQGGQQEFQRGQAQSAEANRLFEKTGTWNPTQQMARADEDWTRNSHANDVGGMPYYTDPNGQRVGVMQTHPFAGGVNVDPTTGNASILPATPGGFQYFGSNGPIGASGAKPSNAPLTLRPEARAAYDAAKTAAGGSPAAPQLNPSMASQFMPNTSAVTSGGAPARQPFAALPQSNPWQKLLAPELNPRQPNPQQALTQTWYQQLLGQLPR